MEDKNSGQENPPTGEGDPATLADLIAKAEGGEKEKETAKDADRTDCEIDNSVKISRVERFMTHHFPDAKAHDRWTLVFSAVVAGSTFLYTAFAGWTLHEIRVGSTDTHNLATAAGTQATKTSEMAGYAKTASEAAKANACASQRSASAAEGFATSAGNINAAMGNAVDKLNLQADALKDSVTQATRLAKDTEIANQNASDADRPWFGGKIVVNDFLVDHTPTATCVFTNSGRRPAKVEQARCSAQILDSIPPNPEYGGVSFSSRAFVVPGDYVSSKINMVNERMYYKVVKDGKYTKLLFDLLGSGKGIFFVFGKVEYTDVRDGTSHFTHSCAQYVPATQFTEAGFSSCETYNDAQ
jgi:hypothetical protein